MGVSEIALTLAVEMLRKSGVLEWNDESTRLAIAEAAMQMAEILAGEGSMALPDYLRLSNATALTFQSSGGNSAITLASLSNAAARQSVKLDLGASRKQAYRVKADMEIAATPTAGATIDFYWAPSTSATAGTDNPGNVSGADAAYAGYSSNLTAALKQLLFIGSLVTTTQATTTVQKGFVGTFVPPTRYGSLIVVNNSGAALHSSDANIVVSFVPDDDTIEDT